MAHFRTSTATPQLIYFHLFNLQLLASFPSCYNLISVISISCFLTGHLIHLKIYPLINQLFELFSKQRMQSHLVNNIAGWSSTSWMVRHICLSGFASFTSYLTIYILTDHAVITGMFIYTRTHTDSSC